MSNPLVTLVSVPSRRFVSTAAIAAGVLAPLAMGASGDLDPSFGDGGRIGPIVDLNGPAWSLEIQDDERIVFAGGDFDLVCRPNRFCDFPSSSTSEYVAAGFIDRLTASGLPDSSFNAPDLVNINIQVLDIALQSDDKIIAVGRYVPPSLGSSRSLESHLIVFRLERSGSLDPSFGVGRLANLPLSAATHGTRHVGTSVLVDSSGRIVIAGIRNTNGLNERIVLRLLTDGSFDETFGNAGLSIGPAIGTGFLSNSFFSGATSILQAATGGYRLTTSESDSGTCEILALTEAGTVDDTYGNAGMASVVTSLGDAVDCNRMVAQADGQMVIAGNANGQGFVTRLLANGESDPGFAADAVPGTLAQATALVLGSDGSITVGGITSDSSDAVVMRLKRNGALDPLFGNAGTSVIDLPTDTISLPVIREMVMDGENRVVAAGGDYAFDPSDPFAHDDFDAPRPFLFRLFGESDSAGPGVIGFVQSSIEAPEPDQVVVNVRRTGGRTGNVSVAYATVPGGETPATGGQDYGEISGRLTWDDGDTEERQIVVQVFDNSGVVEVPEQFRIALSDAQGGAGLATRNATVNIRPDGDPNGQFAIQIEASSQSEAGPTTVWVRRDYYSDGAVSVTLTPVAGTAMAGDDFAAGGVTLSWADQELGAQPVENLIVDDTIEEGNESFTVELSNPTGGALIGPHAVATITIHANDTPGPPPWQPHRSGGGGSTGFLSLLFLGLAAILSSLRRSART